MSGYTTVDNWLFDVVMPVASFTTFKIVCAIARKTWGWQKEQDRISYSQFQAMTGIASRGSIKAAIDDAIDNGWVQRVKRGQYFLYSVTSTANVPLDNKQYGKRTSTSTGNVPVTSTGNVLTKRKDKINNKTRGKGESNPYWCLPDNLKTEGFIKAWKVWLESVDERGLTFSETQARLTLDDLSAMGPQRAMVAVRESARRGWKSVYEPNFSSNGNGNHAVTQDDDGGLYV